MGSDAAAANTLVSKHFESESREWRRKPTAILHNCRSSARSRNWSRSSSGSKKERCRSRNRSPSTSAARRSSAAARICCARPKRALKKSRSMRKASRPAPSRSTSNKSRAGPDLFGDPQLPRKVPVKSLDNLEQIVNTRRFEQGLKTMDSDKKSAWLRKLDEECPYQVVLPRRQLADDSEIMDFLIQYVEKFDMYVEDDYAAFVRYCF